MGTQVPLRHPLRQLFGALTEKSFTEHLGWPDPNVTGYVSNLLVDFTHTDQLYKIKNQQDRPVDTVVDLLFESEVLLEAQSMDRERAQFHPVISLGISDYFVGQDRKSVV